MKRLFTPLLRRFYLAIAVVALVQCAVLLVQYSPWYKEHLYRKLIQGDNQTATEAAFDLAWLGGERQLVRALQDPSPEVRELAQRFLWDLWYKAGGKAAYRQLMAAQEAMDEGREEEALVLLNALIQKHPRFAEAWNRRAILHWRSERYEEAMADVRQAVQLTPMHFGAWSGMAECALATGDYETAWQALQILLRIDPHNEDAPDMLDECERGLGPSTRPPEAPITPRYPLEA
jgi:tetratricopeptide (TPR) repeat protein